jgi:tetratricopeptide (TPR) repeat protein
VNKTLHALLAAVLLVAQAVALDEAELRRQVQALEREGRSAEAVPLYQQLRQLLPQERAVVHNLARALAAAGRHPEAISLLQDWLEAHPQDDQALLLLGEAQHAAGADQKAVKAWRQVLALRPGEARSYLEVSDRCQAAGLFGEAVRVLREGRRVLGQGQLFAWELAELHARQREYEAAVEAYLASLAQAPQRFPLIESRLSSLARTDGEELLKTLEGLVENSTDPLPAARLLAACALEAGRPEKGYQALASVAEGADFLFAYAAQCEARGYDAAAARAYALFAERFPDSPYVYQSLLRRADLASRAADAAQATALYRDLAERFPGQPEALEALVRLGRLQLEVGGNIAEACEALERQGGGWTFAALELGAECSLRSGDLEQAMRRLEKLAGQEAPEAYRARFRLAELRYLQGDFATALAELKSLLDEAPAHELANDALELFLLCDEYQDQPEALQALARAQLLERQARLGEANAQWAWIEEHASPALQEVGLLLCARGRQEEGKSGEALALYERLVELFPQGQYLVAAQMGRAALYEQQGDLEQALLACETALLARPEDARAPQLRLHIERLRRLRGEKSG